MSIFRSKSFFLLVFSGLAIVSLPLVVVLVTSDQLIGRLVKHSTSTVESSVAGSQLSQKLIEHVLNQERKVRQYEVLGDEMMLAEVTNIHIQMQSVVAQLAELPYAEDEKNKIYAFRDKENTVFAAVVNSTPKTLKNTSALMGFEQLSSLSKEIYNLVNQDTYNEIASFQKKAAHAKYILFCLALALIPITGMLIFSTSKIISRPIKQIDRGIRRLGKGDFNSPISISGPDDLVALGKRLDWLREKLVVFEKDKSKFAAHISHELKTPLASIREGVELLSDEVAGPVTANQEDILEIIRKNSLSLQGLIENLLGYTMAQAQQSSLNISNFMLDVLIQKTLEAYKPTMLKKDINIVMHVPPLQIFADRERLATVFDNLISNAVKYSPDYGSIIVTAECQKSRIILEVTDSGPGVPLDEREKVFNAFFQGKISCQSPVKGTGLGLAIAKEYTVAHGGEIELVNNDQQGACFRLTLPVSCVEENCDADN